MPNLHLFPGASELRRPLQKVLQDGAEYHCIKTVRGQNLKAVYNYDENNTKLLNIGMDIGLTCSESFLD